jgi:putative phosphoribosyl transferase
MGKCEVLSLSSEPFDSRAEAGRLLAREVAAREAAHALVLGIPRGGVIVAAEVAEALGGELDIVLTRKLGAPGNPELAIGAVGEDGQVVLNERLAALVGASKDYIDRSRVEALAEISRRAQVYRQARTRATAAGRTVVVTDDGVATGATMQAAIWALRSQRPDRLIVALPVGPEDTLRRLAEDVDELVCLRAPSFFQAVGQFYRDFSQTTDEEVLTALQRVHQEQMR